MYKSKLSQLLCLLLCFLLLSASLSLGVSAASSNLIDSDLTTWSDLSSVNDGSIPCTVGKGNDIYRVTVKNEGNANYIGVVFDDSTLIAGHSYSLSFRLPTLDEINTAFNKSYTGTTISNHFLNCSLGIGVGFLSSSGEISTPTDMELFYINKDNYINYFGRNLKASFVAANYSGTPVVYISFVPSDYSNHSFYFSNFKLVDNDDNSEELTGIKGFLHSIRWDLVGGACKEKDCPHSSDDNPHQSLTARFTGGFKLLFDGVNDNFNNKEDGTTLSDWFKGLSNKFEEGSTLSNWFSGLSDKFEKGSTLDTWFTSLGDKITAFFKDDDGKTFTDWFKDLGGNIKDRFTEIGKDLKDWFEDVGDSFTTLGTNIGGFFTDLKTNMSTWLTDLGTSITTKFQEIGDKFSKFFEKFKPRVTLNLDWKRGSVAYSTGEVTWYPEGGPYPNPYAVVSDFISVPPDSVYYIDYKHISANDRLVIYQYDLEGNYIKYMGDKNSDLTAFKLPSGYNYRLRIAPPLKVNDINDYLSDYVTVYAEEGWINVMLLNIKNSIKSLFVPDEQAILDLKADLDSTLQDHLGIIYTSTTLVSDFINIAFDIVFDAPDTYSLTVPEVSFVISDTNVTLWDDTPIDFSFMETKVFKTIYGMYTVGLYILFGVLEVKYGIRVYRRMMSN